MSENKQYTLEEMAAFLCGETQLDGVWFGEKHPTERGLYWWRKHLRAAVLSASAGEKKVDMHHLQDATVVHVNMMRGNIAKLSMLQMAHVHGEEMVRRWRAFEEWESATNSMQSTKEEKL